MFSEQEAFGIQNAKDIIKSLIKTRNLLDRVYDPGAGSHMQPVNAKNIVIAGGFFTSVLQNNKFKDIDIFVLNNDVGGYNVLTQGFKEQSDKMNNPQPHPSVPLTIFDEPMEAEWSRSEMMSYMHNTNIVDVINNHKTKAQYILTKYKTREELLNHFDYKHCKVSYVPLEDKLYINRETFDCIKNKILKFNNEQSNNPNQKYRKDKYLNTGWVLETPNDEYAGLRSLTSDMIKESYQKIREEMAAKVMGLPPMQQQGTYTITKEAMESVGITAQTMDDIINPIKGSVAQPK